MRRYEILHTLNLGFNFITLRERCNNQRPRCDIELLHVTNNLHHRLINRRCAFGDAQKIVLYNTHIKQHLKL
jgi:hypothetical protein